MKAVGKDGGIGDCESRDVSNGVQISGAAEIADPETFLPCALKAGIISLAFCAESVDALEAEAVAVNRETVIIGNGLVFRAASVFLAIVPVFSSSLFIFFRKRSKVQ